MIRSCLSKITLVLLLFIVATNFCLAQKVDKSPTAKVGVGNIESTPALAELILKRTEYEADLEALLISYTEEFPKVKELQFAIQCIKRETSRLNGISSEKGSIALGKLMVRKVESELEVWKISQTFADEHPDVKRSKKRLEIFEKAIKEILG